MRRHDVTGRVGRHLRGLGSLQLLRLSRGRPVSQHWGWDRGRPIDRHFIELFLAEHRSDIRGRVLEVKSDDYAREFGSGIEAVDVLDVDHENADATIVDDLALLATVANESFDCVLLTQTLQYVYDVRSALRQTSRILRPGGVLLATVPAISRDLDPGRHTSPEYWRFTEASCRALVVQEFGDPEPLVRPYGDVYTSVSFLAGLAAEEVSRRRLSSVDRRFPTTLAFRAVRR